MKQTDIFVVIIFICALVACNRSVDNKYTTALAGTHQPVQTTDKFQESIQNADSVGLVLNVSIVGPYMAVGFASVYKCKVNKIKKGTITDTIISITILSGDHNNDSLLSECIMKPKQIEIGFLKNKSNEEFWHSSGISGFVDKSRTSWKIIYIKTFNQK